MQSSITYTLTTNVENLILTGTSALGGTGNALDNVLTGNSGNNALNGMGGNDTYFLTSGDTVTEAAGGGEDLVNIGATHTLATNVENLILTGTTAINGTGNGSNNLLRGNSGVNTLAGAAGNDVLEGGDGNDIVGDTGGKNLLNGQGGADTLNGNTGNELLIGGAGNDTVNTSSGADIIAFNRGDGADTVAVSTAKDNSLSLGGGIAYADLFFQKTGTNLILKTAGSAGAEQVTFTNWYSAAANRSVLTLQVIVQASADFDAGSADPLKNKKVAFQLRQPRQPVRCGSCRESWAYELGFDECAFDFPSGWQRYPGLGWRPDVPLWTTGKPSGRWIHRSAERAG